MRVCKEVELYNLGKNPCTVLHDGQIPGLVVCGMGSGGVLDLRHCMAQRLRETVAVPHLLESSVTSLCLPSSSRLCMCM